MNEVDEALTKIDQAINKMVSQIKVLDEGQLTDGQGRTVDFSFVVKERS